MSNCKPSTKVVLSIMTASVVALTTVIVAFPNGGLEKIIFYTLPMFLSLIFAASYRIDALKEKEFKNKPITYWLLCCSVFFFSSMISYFISGNFE